MGTLWSIQEPLTSAYAQCEARVPFDSTGVCSECLGPRPRRVKPFRVEWCFGSADIGDFSWPGYAGEALVSERVASVLLEEVGGVTFETVEYVDTGGCAEGKRARRLPRVTLPPAEARLLQLQVLTYAPLDMKHSAVAISSCSTCGRGLLTVSERTDYDVAWVGEDPVPKWRLQSGGAGRGVVIEEACLGDSRLFALEGLPLSLYCTEDVRRLAVRERWTNVKFLVAGETR